MKKYFSVIFTFCILASGMYASIEEDILESTNSLKRFIETNKIPNQVLKDAKAIVIIPNYMKASFFIGGQYGEGLVIFRKNINDWSNPYFVSVTGGSLGIQFGFESSDTLLIFRTQKSISELLKNKVTIGTELSASVGPIKENYNIYKEANFKSDILTYYIKEGLFVGASFDGAVVQHNDEKNSQMYGANRKALDVINSDKRDDIYGIRELDKTIRRYSK